MQIHYHFSSDHKPAFEADQLIVPTYSTLMCILQSPGSPELGSSQMRLVQRMRAVSQGSWTRRLTQDWARAGKTRSPWNAYTEVVSPRSFTLQVLLHCHVYILCLPRHSNPEGNKCSTPRFPVVRPCLGVSWWSGASPRGLIGWGKPVGGVTELTRPLAAGDRVCHFSTQPCLPSVCLLLLLGCCSRCWVTTFIEKFLFSHKQLILKT